MCGHWVGQGDVTHRLHLPGMWYRVAILYFLYGNHLGDFFFSVHVHYMTYKYFGRSPCNPSKAFLIFPVYLTNHLDRFFTCWENTFSSEKLSLGETTSKYISHWALLMVHGLHHAKMPLKSLVVVISKVWRGHAHPLLVWYLTFQNLTS